MPLASNIATLKGYLNKSKGHFRALKENFTPSVRWAQHNEHGYLQVFSKGIGKLAGEYHVRVDSTVDPIQHAPHRVPVALRTKVKEALADLK